MKRVALLFMMVLLCVMVIPQTVLGLANSPQTPANRPNLSDIISIADQNGTDYYVPSVAYNWKHKEYFVVWHSPDNGVFHVYGQRINALTGERIGAEPDVIASGTKDKLKPDVDYDPVHDRYLVVWSYELSASDTNISGRFVPWDGSDPTLQEFSITEFSCYEYDPRVAYGRANQEFMVVGAHFCGGNPEDVWGQMVPADGTGFNPKLGITVAVDGTYGRNQPDIAWNRGTNEFLVVYSYELAASGGGTEWDTYGKLFNGTGTEQPGSLYFGISANDEIRPAVAAAGNNDTWLVVWQEMISGDYDLKADMFRGDLTWVDSMTISAYGGHQQFARVGSNYGENGFMVVYEEDISGYTGISARPVHLDGTMGDGLQVQYATPNPGNSTPAVIGGHTNFMAVWRNRESSGTTAIYGKFLTPYAVFMPVSLRQP